ncbi:MAG TPA: hypothetical protein VF608_03605, partial [Thermoanaerobaculia bacterium]
CPAFAKRSDGVRLMRPRAQVFARTGMTTSHAIGGAALGPGMQVGPGSGAERKTSTLMERAGAVLLNQAV